MVQKEFNAISSGASGKFSNQLTLRIRKGKLFFCKNKSASSEPPTEGQVATQSMFKRAAAWARKAIKNLDLRKLYKAKATDGASPYNVALADYCQPPVVVEVATESYTGAIGDNILIEAKDNVAVTGVTVDIFNAANELLETGAAIMGDDDTEWLYSATQVNGSLTGSRILVTATDNPGNKGTKEVVLS